MGCHGHGSPCQLSSCPQLTLMTSRAKQKSYTGTVINTLVLSKSRAAAISRNHDASIPINSGPCRVGWGERCI